MDEECVKYCEFVIAYNILMDYWDFFPEDLRPEIHERLKGVHL